MLIRHFIFIAMIGSLILGAMGEPAWGKTVRVSKHDCANVVRHTPAPDVAYKPGVDVYGRKVAPADLGGSSPFKVPDVISFDLNLDFLNLAPQVGNTGAVFGRPSLGKISVQGHQVYLDGKPLGGIGQAEVIKKCREALSGKR